MLDARNAPSGGRRFTHTVFPALLVDRCNRHRLLLFMQTLAMVQAFLLALLTWTGRIDVGQLIILSLFLGVINTFDMTTRQAFL